MWLFRCPAATNVASKVILLDTAALKLLSKDNFGFNQPKKKTSDRWKNFDENVGSNINDIVVIMTDGNLVDQYKGHSFDFWQHEHLFSTPCKKGVNP